MGLSNPLLQTSAMNDDVSGEQLRALRLAAGLDVAVLARRVSLSNAQLMQLENDQHSLFYTPAIRRHAARKVLTFLGTQPQAEQQSEAAAAGPAVLAGTQPLALPSVEAGEASAVPNPSADLPVRDSTEQLFPAAAVMSPAGQAPALVGAGPQTLAHRRAEARSGGSSGIWWMGLFLVVTLLSAWLVINRPFTGLMPSFIEGRGSEQESGLIAPSPAASVHERPHSVVADAAAADRPKTDNESDLVAMAPAFSLPAQPSHAGSPSMPPSIRPDEGTLCPVFQEAAPAISLKSAPRQGSLIYLVSSVSQLVCARDGHGKLKVHRLEPGQATGVGGPPPWTLQASSLQKVQVYFQGGRVSLPADAKDRVQLVEPR